LTPFSMQSCKLAMVEPATLEIRPFIFQKWLGKGIFGFQI
jgi:hypothetical protein